MLSCIQHGRYVSLDTQDSFVHLISVMWTMTVSTTKIMRQGTIGHMSTVLYRRLLWLWVAMTRLELNSSYIWELSHVNWDRSNKKEEKKERSPAEMTQLPNNCNWITENLHRHVLQMIGCVSVMPLRRLYKTLNTNIVLLFTIPFFGPSPIWTTRHQKSIFTVLFNSPSLHYLTHIDFCT